MDRIWLKSYPDGVEHDISSTAPGSLIDLFEETVHRFSNLPAYSLMGSTMSYRDLDHHSLDFATFLQQNARLKPGDRIAIQVPNILAFPVAFFGAMRAGLTAVNTNPLYTPREMRHQFKDSGAKAIVIFAQFVGRLEEIIDDTDIHTVIVVEAGDLLGFAKALVVNAVVRHVQKAIPPIHIDFVRFTDALKRGHDGRYRRPKTSSDDIALLQYTGGTTGVSKGAMLTHGNMLSNLAQMKEWLKPCLVDGEEIVITALPLYHIFSLTVNCLLMFRIGGKSVLIPDARALPDVIKAIKKERPTMITAVNTLLNGLLNKRSFTELKLDHVKLTVAGGMALQSSVAERWIQLTNTFLVEGYGLTEASPVVSCNPLTQYAKLGSIGTPLPSTHIRLIGDDGKERGVGEAGELCIRGPQVMKGYWNLKEETEKVLTADGWLSTGDIASIDHDGFIRIVDRKKDMILVSGFNVYPNEIEDVLMQHPGIAECGVIGVPDRVSGEIVKAFIVSRDENLTTDDIKRHCKRQLAGYKIPKLIEFRTSLPKTNIGKILRKDLR